MDSMKPISYIIALVLCASATGVCADPAADNTGKNQRDRSGQNPTSQDQSNNADDLKVTQAIRRAIVKDSNLSSNAKNVKIITGGGKVTLRGPVNSTEEKEKVEKVATDASGNRQVDNQLEVKQAR
jgi:hyperosmotically inducible periplasmic protein